MQLRCCYCGFVWTPRVDQPRACVFCKRYFDDDHKPEPVADEIKVKFTERQLRHGIVILDSSAQIKCSFCDRPAVMNAYGRNVCESHAGTVILERRITPKSDEQEDALEQIASSAVDMANNIREAFQIALREAKETYPENEVMIRVQQIWIKRKM